MWKKVCSTHDVPENGGACVLEDDEHIAIFNATTSKQWFAVQNECPHKKQSVLSRGIIGDANGELKISCPLHKNSFSLNTGCHLGEEDMSLKTYPIEIRGEDIYLDM